MSLKRSDREGSKPIKNNTSKNTSHRVTPTLGVNLEDYEMENFCRAQYTNHSEKKCPVFMKSFKAMILPWECQEEGEEEEEEEEQVEPSSNIHLIWNDIELDDIHDDIMEEACVVEDLKKTKEKIIVFELCKITQLKEKLKEVLQ